MIWYGGIRRRWLVFLLFLGAPASTRLASCADGYQVIHVYPHDPEAYTQGLIYLDGHLYESTGRNRHSSLRTVDLKTGRVLRRFDLPAEYFGEGLTDWGSNLIQLTWINGKGFVYDRATFKLLRTFDYSGEGWGLTHDDTSLILSDGTPVLRFLDPQTFREVRRLTVTDENGRQVQDLNELEFVRGEIYANVWHSKRIARISPSTGRIVGWIDLSGLLDSGQLSDPEAVLNGIAYDREGDRLFVTGKLWPNLFEIKVSDSSDVRSNPGKSEK